MNKKLLVALFLSLGSLSAIGMNNQYGYMPQPTQPTPNQAPQQVAPMPDQSFMMQPQPRTIKTSTYIIARIKQSIATVLMIPVVAIIPVALFADIEKSMREDWEKEGISPTYHEEQAARRANKLPMRIATGTMGFVLLATVLGIPAYLLYRSAYNDLNTANGK